MNKVGFFIELFVTIVALFFIGLGIKLIINLKTIFHLLSLVSTLWFLNTIFCLLTLFSNKITYTKNCWLIVILIFPFFGIAFFCLFEIKPIAKRTKDKFHLNKERLEKFNFFHDYQINEHEQVPEIFLNSKINKKDIYRNNEVVIIDDSTLILDQLVKLIRMAKHTINLQSFIFRSQSFFTKIIFLELIKKSKEGVKIKILYDHFGTVLKKGERILKWIEQYGIEIACFNPLHINIFTSSTNYRLHSKFVIIDNESCFYGGSNFGDEYLSMAKNECLWTDLNVVIKGPIVQIINQSFLNYWLTFGHNRKKKNNFVVDEKYFQLTSGEFAQTNTTMQLLCFTPKINSFSLNETILNEMAQAQKTIKITTPYFCPTQEINDFLKLLAMKGVKIEIVVPAKNVWFTKMMNEYCYNQIVNENITLYEYAGFIHSKIILIDDKYTLLGSFNLDYRSIYFDFESQLIVDNYDFAQKIVKIFEQYKFNSTKKNIKQKTKYILGKATMTQFMLLCKTLF